MAAKMKLRLNDLLFLCQTVRRCHWGVDHEQEKVMVMVVEGETSQRRVSSILENGRRDCSSVDSDFGCLRWQI
jgi:hypothetical protein